ncbi:MAG: fibrillarin-like rRNA/tRNA 2'-O-methyltransferase [Thaumarchaeota archaeon]|nr:fibrillarin-like rRNA/tRNA 2'-O-methyltransferase [Nitrososphaerota archaeon]
MSEESSSVNAIFDDSVFFVKNPKNPSRKIIATKNLTPGHSYYGETLVTYKFGGERAEFRSWDPFRSKLSASIMNKLEYFPFSKGSRCLYLGASTGTTVSHLSDIVGTPGTIFAVEVAPRVARELLENVVKYRKNVVPIIADAKHPEKYPGLYGVVDFVYCDIAQPDQTEIAIQNCRTYFEKGVTSTLFLVVKASSIDALKPKKEIFSQQVHILERSGFQILQQIDLEPYDRNHAMLVAKIGFTNLS